MTAPYIPPPDQQTVMQTLLGLVGRPQPQPQRPMSFGDQVFAHLYQLARAAQDATRVNNAPPQQPQWTIGPVTPGNTPLPEATVQSQYQPRYDKAMNLLADMIPVLGSIRGVQAGHNMAQAGNPWLGAITAAAALGPEGGNLAAKGIKSVAVHSAADAEREALDRLAKTAAKIRPESKAADQWFAGSHVATPQGEPLTVYHGTTAPEFSEFKVGHAPGWGDGIYFTDNAQQAAEEFGFGGRVIKAHLAIKNPYRGETIPEDVLAQTKAWKDVAHKWEDPAQAWQEDSKFVGKALRELGYDGVITEGSNGINGKEIVAFHPNQVRMLKP